MPVLDWIGKEAVVDHVRHVPFRLLDVDPSLSTDLESPNLIVEGDNLEALRALLPQYAGRVRCIYIDPPYNTGNEGWAYNDAVNGPEIQAWLGKTVGRETEDFSRHDKWLCMMYPRLALLWELLADDGSIWISLDDNEAHHVRMLMDMLFGPQNFVANVIWQKKFSPANDAKLISSSHDHLFVYAKSAARWRPNKLEKSERATQAYKNPDGDERGRWMSGDYTCNKSAAERENLYYAITNPTTGEAIWPSKGRAWAYSPERHAQNVAEDCVWWGVDGTNGVPRYKRFLSDVDAGVVPQTVWTWQEVGHTQDAAREQLEILPDDPFDTPKPSSLIERVLAIATGPDDIVLDAFAGSGTTAHAVLAQNARDGGDRQFVLVEMLPEIAGPVTAERVRRVAEGYAYSGTSRTELLRTKLTVTALRKMSETMEKAAALKEEHASAFDRFEEKVEKGAFVLRGVSDVAEAKPGLGGGFRFARLGAPLVGDDGRLSAAATPEAVARLAYFAVAKRPLVGAPGLPLVGVHDGRAVYLLGADAGGDGAASGGVLTRRTLAALPPHDGPRVVFATASRIGAADLAAEGVEFRQIPYALPA